MFGIGGGELVLILLFGFLIFGPDKLPAMAKTLGRAISKFKSAQEEMSTVIKNEVYDPTSDEPFKNPVNAMDKAAQVGKKAVADVKETAKEAKSSVSSSKTAAAKAAAGTAGVAATSAAAGKTVAKQESFTERKARYERERAAKQAAEAEKAANEAEAAKQAEKEAAQKIKEEAAKKNLTPEGTMKEEDPTKLVPKVAEAASSAPEAASGENSKAAAKPATKTVKVKKPANAQTEANAEGKEE